VLYIAGDIGGSNSRLQLHDHKENRLLAEKIYPSPAYKEERKNQWPVVCCFAVAGPVRENKCRLTNVRWTELNGEQMRDALGVKEVVLINDFVAVGYALLSLNLKQGADVLVLNNKQSQEKGNIACLGAGTGLGETFLTWSAKSETYDCHPTEGGHSSFSPQSDLEFRLMQYLKQRLRLHHVSVERLVSGPGIPLIYEFLCCEYPHLVSKETQRRLGSLSRERFSELIVNEAKMGEPLCRRTVELFVDLYGAEAGNLAVKTLPFGGFYIAGGIAPKILNFMTEEDRFWNAFKAKGRMEKVLQDIPVYVVLNKQIGEIGAQIKARMIIEQINREEGTAIRSKL